MRRRPFFAAIAVGTTAMVLGAGGAAVAGGGAAYDRHGAVRNILPAGSDGNVDAAQLAAVGPSRQATPTTPKNYENQLEMYDALNRVVPGKINATTVAKDYKDARLGVAAKDVVSTETPKAGVVIKRDKFGVPHISGKTDDDVAYGAGYAGIEDRMFLTDLLRHVGAAEMSAFLGPSASDIAMDESQLRIAPYTPAQAEAQIAKVAKRYPKAGPPLLKRLDAFLAGVNAAQKKLCPGAFGLPTPGDNGSGLGVHCPVEYAALQKSPTLYTRADIVYIASLVGGIFGKGGGNEYSDALWYEALKAKFGQAKAEAIYNDLREKNDPEAFTSATTRFPYLTGGVRPNLPGVALPVPDAKTAPGTGFELNAPLSAQAPLPSSPRYQRWLSHVGSLDTPLGHMDLRMHPRDMSNALLLGRQHSTDGHPIAVFGPQTGYFEPQLLTEVDLHGPDIDARGVSFAGTQFVVELGHGVDYAWSATSADSDLVDTVMERLCNPNHSKPTVNSTHYLRGRKCVPLVHYVHDEGAIVPTAGGTGPPKHLKFDVYKTRHGVVQFRTIAKDRHGKKHPVAVVTERSTYGHEADSVLGFVRVNNPHYVHSAKDFIHAFNGVDYTFNWFYVDDKDIAYKVSGLLPRRSKQVEPDFPRWGTAKYDWKGWLSANRHPHQIDPPCGFTASWNNKQAPGFGVADDQWGQSKVHRVNLLVDRIRKLIAHGHKVTRPELVGAMMSAATADLRGEKLLPLALDVIGKDKRDRPAVRLLRSWVHAGAHRVDRKRTGHYAHQAAIALFDTWWDNNGHGNGGLAKDTLRPGLHSLVNALPYSTDDHPRQHLGSSWDTVAWYGYVSRALRMALDRHVVAPYSRAYCGSLTTCRKALRRSLHVAVHRALKAQGVSSVRKLTYDKSNDDIVSTTAGIVGVRNIDWQNRPTFQQAVNFRHHRPGHGFTGRFGPAAAGVAAPSDPVADAARFGGLGLVVLALAGLLVPLLRRRPSRFAPVAAG